MPEGFINPILEGRDVARSFSDGKTETHVLTGVSVELYPGQITLLMGPSGSGKTTLLACLSGLLRPNKINGGQVFAVGEDLWAMSELQRERFRLRNFGFIFQGYNLFAALTARQQLEMVVRWGEGTTTREARRRADAVLEQLDMSDKAHLRPGEMSGGEKQRVAIGRALVKRPTVLFADEPTSALDWQHGVQVIDLLRTAAKESQTSILVVAHDSRIIPMVDRVLEMDDGVLHERSIDDSGEDEIAIGAGGPRLRLDESGVY